MNTNRILSLIPGTRDVGYCVFEGTQLLDWGVKGGARTTRVSKGLGIVESVYDLIDLHAPDIIVLPAKVDSRRKPGQPKIIDAVVAGLSRHAVRVVHSSDSEVRACLADLAEIEKPTKHAIMTYLGQLFPELQPVVPKLRRPWDPQDYWTTMFDAVAQAVTWITKSL